MGQLSANDDALNPFRRTDIYGDAAQTIGNAAEAFRLTIFTILILPVRLITFTILFVQFAIIAQIT